MALDVTPERWEKIQAVVDALFDLAPAEQEEYARKASGDDVLLYDEVMQVLAFEDRSMTFLDSPAMASLSNTSSEQDLPDIEGYRLRERIGVGGMGVVYRAERDQGDFTQQVAIKLLPQWQARTKSRQRFRQEQQLLANLEHPNIATLYGGGMSAAGLPYLIMEYVDGMPIDNYCNENQLGLAIRLRLVRQVATALQHAHSQLIVHRDIKPSNILVTPEGEVKLLDFGIAKLVGEVDLNLTRTEEQLMTPGYAAPEQVLNLPITVSTDVYQLGLVAYLLFTGRQVHFDASESVGELVSAICEKEPVKPSQAVDANAGLLSSGVGAASWSKSLRGELDAILLTMLRTHQNERYASMAEVVADFDAYVDHRPISSLSQSSTYHAKKWLRRYRSAVSVTGLFVVMLAAYAITTSIQSKKIAAALTQSDFERQKAQSVADFMVDMFKAADPNVSGINTITANQLLEQGMEKMEGDSGISPSIQARMLTSIGEIYYSQGQIEESRTTLELALVKQKLESGGNELDLAKTLTNLAVIYNQTAAHSEAEQLYIESLNLQNSRFADNKTEERFIANLAETYNGYGVLLLDRGQLLEAERRISQSVELLKGGKLTHHEQYANALSNLATIRITQGRLQEASDHMKAVIELQERTTGDTHPFFSLYLVSLANVLVKLEHFDEARPYIDRAILLQVQILGENHPDLANSKRNLGVLIQHQGDIEQAEKELREALIIREANFLKPSLMTGNAYRQLGSVLIDKGEYDEAKTALEQMSHHYSSVNAGNITLGLGSCSQARWAYRQGFYEKALINYERAMEQLAGNDLRLAVAETGYAQTLLRLNKTNRSIEYARKAFTTRSKRLPVGHSLIGQSQAVLGLAHAQNEQLSQARSHLRNSIVVLESSSSSRAVAVTDVLTMARARLASL
ncbi:hypothetical protein NBRC116583_11160 [Arenicella sp. 4NH20-0111]|uniref:serine/threonine-protein kinase n=1 Tax=Arenicella sp. 4NH20-0111 TaxID=3127648 RepID=UPI0031049C78